jgi:hypothetical protein
MDETPPIRSFWRTLRNWYAASSWRELARIAGDEERYARELRRWRAGQHVADFRTISEMLDCLNERHAGRPLPPTGSYACYLMARMLEWFGSQRQLEEALAYCSTAGIDVMSGPRHPGRSPFAFIASRCRRWNELFRDQVAAGEFWEAGSAGS